MPSFGTPGMARGHQSLVMERYNNPDWSPETRPAQRLRIDKKGGQAVKLNLLGEGYFNVDQNNQSHFCKRVDEEVC